MLGFLFNRFAWLLVTLWGVVTLTFLLLHLAPGDPVDVLLGDQAVAADREMLREQLGLNLPLWQQYADYMYGVVVADWGTSLFDKTSVLGLIGERWPATAQLAVAALVFALCVGFPLGILSAQFRGRWPDSAIRCFSLAGLAMPSFWLGPLLMIVFALWLGLVPVAGQEGWNSMILPSVTLGLPMAAVIARLLRVQMLEVLHADFVKTAQAKGCTETQVLLRHAVRNALLPVMTVVFLQAGALLTGAILTEAVFAWPGLGSLLVESLQRRDYPVVQGCVLLIALVYMLATFLSDVAYAYVDPRVRYGN